MPREGALVLALSATWRQTRRHRAKRHLRIRSRSRFGCRTVASVFSRIVSSRREGTHADSLARSGVRRAKSPTLLTQILTPPAAADDEGPRAGLTGAPAPRRSCLRHRRIRLRRHRPGAPRRCQPGRARDHERAHWRGERRHRADAAWCALLFAFTSRSSSSIEERSRRGVRSKCS
jgi:hypothetical protein